VAGTVTLEPVDVVPGVGRRFKVLLDGRHVGMGQIGPGDPAEVSLRIMPGARGVGVGRRAVRLLLEAVSSATATGTTALPNDAAVVLMRSVGATIDADDRHARGVVAAGKGH